MSIDITEVEKEIAEAKQHLADLEAMHRILSRRSDTSGSKPVKATTPTIGESGTINLDDLQMPKKADRKKATLHNDIKNVTERFGNQEFTVTHVEVALQQMGKGSTAKHFKNRVSTEIRKLTDSNFLTRTYEGFGNDPHRYRLKNPSVSFIKK